MAVIVVSGGAVLAALNYILIAAEMLVQNPGLGEFVWDEFHNGRSSLLGSNSLGRIMVAVLVIGFVLGWMMVTLEKRVSYDRGVGQ